MLKSMTGYGQAVKETETFTARAEVRSVNSRGLDLNIRVPKSFSEKEITLRSTLNNTLQRGKIMVQVELEYHADKVARKAINEELFHAYYTELKGLASQHGQNTDSLFALALQMPDVMVGDAAEPTDEDWAAAEIALNDAVKAFDAFRLAEGHALAKELAGYIESIGKSLSRIDDMKTDRLMKIKSELQQKITDLAQGQADENRLEQEILFYAERLDITEEIVRLRTHLDYFIETMKEDYPGKKLGFISQEIGREINTIGSKANDADIQRWVVLMKEELEKIKEQVLNVL
jgi:uncharacterized protein (TIGR00255 family)